jgi:sugar phosphate isomerase/epimerase
VAEAPRRKDLALMALPELASVARQAGYRGVSMRASQVGLQSTPAEIAAARATLDAAGLAVSMVTANYDVPANNERAGVSLREIGRHLDVAQALGCDLVRVGMKALTDIPRARRACDEAAERGMRIAHQLHVCTLFEQVEMSLRVVREVGRPNFGLVYEPSNLLVCGEDYGEATIRAIAPHLFNVYLQNIAPRAGAPNTIETWVNGPIAYDLVPFGDPRGIDFPKVFAALAAVGYGGWVTVHHNVANGTDIAAGSREIADFLRGIAQFE